MAIFENGLIPLGGGDKQMENSPNYTMGSFQPPEPPKQRRKTMLENIKGYVEKHKDILFTLGLIILIDHFMFKGALKERIKTSIEGVLKKVEDRFHKDIPTKEA